MTCSLFSLSRLRPASLHIRMMLLVTLLIVALIAISGGLYLSMMDDLIEDQIGKRALQVALVVSVIPEVKEQLRHAQPVGQLQQLAERIRQSTDAEFIVIGNRDSIRFSHPDPEKVGKTMVGGDNALALEEGRAYISRAVGTLGPSIRGKVPVFDNDGTVIGVVSVGYLMERIHDMAMGHQRRLLLVITLVLAGGILAASVIASWVKSVLCGLEPEEIARLFSQRNAIIESIREGIIATDRHGLVTMVNQVAVQELGRTHETELLGRDIAEVFPCANMDQLLAGDRKLDRETEIGGTPMIVNLVPLRHGESINGSVASFRRKDELDNLARQLSQVREYAEMMRAQTHEYSNKLHTIGGLIQLGDTKRALELIGRETADYQDLIAFLAQAVRDPMLSALVIGKYSYAQQLRVRLEVDPESGLGDLPAELNREKLVAVLGNLLDNAFESALQFQKRLPLVRLSMSDGGDDLVFEVEDSGTGVPPELYQRIFDKGFSTKREGRGQGLHLVQRALTALSGELSLTDSDLGGARFTVFIPKQPRA